MSGVPPGISSTQTKPPSKKWLKRVMARLERRESKRVQEAPETETNPKRRYGGWG